MLSDRLREARQAAGLTQAEAADRIGVFQGVLARWELGQYDPRARALPWIAQAYGVTTDWLLEVEKWKER